MLFDSAYMAYMRDWAGRSFDTTVTVVHPTTTACYGSTYTSGCTTATYSAALYQQEGGETVDAARVSELTMWRLALPTTAAISASDVVFDAAGNRYEVRRVDDPKSHAIERVVDVELMR